eukprot:Skav207222  [mRNA]  locus=scaffold1244:181297:185739:- [translate_table: standard]
MSNKVSSGQRESAQPTTAVCGACPDLTKALRMGAEVPVELRSPETNLSLPNCSFFRASSGGTEASSPVRTPSFPRLAAALLICKTIVGGRAASDFSRAAC